jgi:hypothetical protein
MTPIPADLQTLVQNFEDAITQAATDAATVVSLQTQLTAAQATAAASASQGDAARTALINYIQNPPPPGTTPPPATPTGSSTPSMVQAALGVLHAHVDAVKVNP